MNKNDNKKIDKHATLNENIKNRNNTKNKYSLLQVLNLNKNNK